METKLVLLGTGTPNACPNASGPASAVVVGDRAYLVDFGPGVVRQASKAYFNGIDALPPGPPYSGFFHPPAYRPYSRIPGPHFHPMGIRAASSFKSLWSKRLKAYDQTHFNGL